MELRVEAGMGSMLRLCLMPRMREALSGRRWEGALGLEDGGVTTVI